LHRRGTMAGRPGEVRGHAEDKTREPIEIPPAGPKPLALE